MSRLCMKKRRIPLCFCCDGHTRDKICNACSTSSPCSPLKDAPLVGGRSCGKAHSRSDRISSTTRKKRMLVFKCWWCIRFAKDLPKYNCKLRLWCVECCPHSFSYLNDCGGIVMDWHLTTLNGCRYFKKVAWNFVAISQINAKLCFWNTNGQNLEVNAKSGC